MNRRRNRDVLADRDTGLSFMKDETLLQPSIIPIYQFTLFRVRSSIFSKLPFCGSLKQ